MGREAGGLQEGAAGTEGSLVQGSQKGTDAQVHSKAAAHLRSPEAAASHLATNDAVGVVKHRHERGLSALWGGEGGWPVWTAAGWEEAMRRRRDESCAAAAGAAHPTSKVASSHS